MKKNEKIQDSPEFQYYKDDFENFKKRMEDDKEYADLKMPDGWEQDFATTIDDALDGKERKRRNRIAKRIVGVAAAVVLVVGVGNLTVEQVSGENLLEMFMNQLSIGEKQLDIYGNYTDVEFDEDNSENILYFDETNLEEVCNQIREELKSPMFYLGYLPDGFTVEEASYEKAFRIINIKLVNQNSEYIYVFQQKQIEDTASGIVAEDIEEDNEENFIISNRRLGKSINILKSYQDNSYVFNVRDNNDVLTINTSLSEEECTKIAENVYYN